MKKQILTLAVSIMAAVALTATSFAQSPLFKVCEKIKGTTTVYISNAMLGMLKGSDISGRMEFGSLMDKIDHLEIISAETPEAVKRLNAETDIFTPQNGYELLINTKDDDESVNISMKKGRDGMNTYVILAREPDESSVILLYGTMTMGDVMNAAGSGKSAKGTNVKK